MAYSLQNPGYTCFRADQHAKAERHLREGLEICRTFGFRRLQGMLLDTVGSVCLTEGRLGEAKSSYLQALAVPAEMDETPQIPEVCW